MGQDEDQRNVGYQAVGLDHHVYAEGEEILFMRATRANWSPIMASPTNPRATERLIRNPLPGSGPRQAKTSGAIATSRYTSIQNAARTDR